MKKHFLIALISIMYCTCFSQEITIIPNIEATTIIANGLNGGPATITNDFLGVDVDNIGDLNNDGVEDMVIGAFEDDNGASSTTDYGAIYVCFMTTSKTVSSYVKIGKATSGIGSDISSQNYFGRSVAGIGDLNHDGNEDIAVGAYGTDITSYQNSGAVYVILLNSSAGIVSYKKITRGTNGGPTSLVANSWFGKSVTNLGDVNGDRINDIGVGGDNHAITGGSSNGAYWTLIMNTNGTVYSNGFVTSGTGWGVTLDNGDQFGVGCAGTGDLNGDGIGDVLVGAYGDDDYFTNSGCAYLLYLNSSGTVSSYVKYKQPLVNRTRFSNSATSFGSDVYSTDLNQDGEPEFLIGSQAEGAVFVLSLDTSEQVISAKKYGNLIHSTQSLSAGGIGYGLTSMNDLDGDGKLEIVFGGRSYDASPYTNSGSVYIVDLTSTDLDPQIGNVLDYDKYGDKSNSIDTLDASDDFGSGVCEIGDVNGDGYNDIAIGAFGDDDGGTNRGAVYIVFLDSLQHKDTVVKISSTTGGFGTGLDDSDQFGISVCGPGDLNADGVPDLIVGAFLDDDGGADRGAVHILYLNSNGTVASKKKISSGTNGFSGTLSNSCRFGFSVAAPGDINNDGVNDLAIGATLGDDGGGDRGEVWIVFLDTTETVIGQQKISDTQGNFTATFSANSVQFGVSVCAAGDMNADGKEDILVGSFTMDGKGAVYVIYLDTLGKAIDYKKISNQNSNFPYTIQSGNNFGRAVDVIDDLDGDGNREILIGQFNYTSNTVDRGAVWLCFTDSLQNVTDAHLISEDTSFFNSTIIGAALFGASLSTYRDADSAQHILIGAYGDNENSVGEGSVYRVKLATINSAFLYNEVPQYCVLKRKLDENYYKPAKGILRFAYEEEYNDSDGALTYAIYKTGTNTVGVPSPPALSVKLGQNRFQLNLNTINAGSPLATGYYVLEVTNEKNEKSYLKFYKS